MAENKRFQYNVNENTIEQGGKFVAYMNCVDGVRVANKLNVLQKENEELKEENQRLEKQKNVLINYMDNWCPKRFYDGIIKRMEEVE